MAFQSLKKCPKIDAILSHERAQWSGLVTSFGEPAVMSSSVHLSPGSSSFLPKYDINNNYSKLVSAIFTKVRTMIELRSVNIL